MTSSSDPRDEIVNFPVPKQYLGLVIQTLAEAMQEDSASTLPSSSDPAVPEAEVADVSGERVQVEWTAGKLKSLRYELDAPAALTMLDIGSERPGAWFNFDEVHSRSSRSRGEARGDMMKLTWTIKRMLSIKHKKFNWPVEVRHGNAGQIEYRMNPKVAEAWRTAANE